ncbi:MAG TPA: deoxyribose-phosphate aldolase [Paenibacillus sp.]|jgi:deoxyribose-phosphate aldolase
MLNLKLAGMIDHTLLRADATKVEITKLTEEAIKYEFASVCVNPTWVSYAAEQLANSKVNVCTVIGFPLGANTSATKAFEASHAIECGADEVDVVINVAALKDGDYDYVVQDIKGVVDAAAGKALVKVIIEACLLTEEEKKVACQLSVKAGAEYVKTSTGFSTGGAKAEDVALMRQVVGDKIGVKASGGVRNLQDMEQLVAAGASRIGASSGVKIMEGEQSTSSY